MKITKALGILGVAGLLMGGVANSSAAVSPVIWSLDFNFGTDDPSGPLVITLSDTGSGVQIEADATQMTGEFEFITGLFFNYDPNAADNLTAPSFSTSDGVSAPTSNLGDNSYKADGDGSFDIRLDFETAGGGRFMAGDTVTLTFEGATLDNFISRSTSSEISEQGLLVAARIQGIDNAEGDGEGSAWTTVPEPSTYIAAALLLIPILVQLRRWRRAKVA